MICWLCNVDGTIVRGWGVCGSITNRLLLLGGGCVDFEIKNGQGVGVAKEMTDLQNKCKVPTHQLINNDRPLSTN